LSPATPTPDVPKTAFYPTVCSYIGEIWFTPTVRVDTYTHTHGEGVSNRTMRDDETDVRRP